MRELWPHQRRGIEGFMRLKHDGPVCITSPTGGGKSQIIIELIRMFGSATLYTNRKLLTGQMIDDLEEAGMFFGVRAAAYKDRLRLAAPIQISSMQTEERRVYKQKKWKLTKPELVLVDECHMQARGTAEKIIREHHAQGAAVCGLTATPLEISHLYKHLVVAGVNSELRETSPPCHIVCRTFEPGTLDIRKIKTGEFTDGDVVKEVWTPAIFGHVLEHYHRLNPDQLPTIVRCPSVDTAVWMAEQFTSHGVPAASLDGEEIVIDGVRQVSDEAARRELMRKFDTGEIPVITFRDVLREAWNCPKLYHLILASPISSLSTYLQVVGRLLRAHPSLDHVILQDHGGNYLRHGSPNADRDWQDIWRLAPEVITGERIEKMREKKIAEPIVCPKCKATRHPEMGGLNCYNCGHQAPRKSREIIQSDGTLREVDGDIFKQRTIRVKPDTARIWEECYFRCRKSGRTFNQARGLFFYENHYYPPSDLPRMPVRSRDWWQKCNAEGVPLIQREMAL